MGGASPEVSLAGGDVGFHGSIRRCYGRGVCLYWLTTRNHVQRHGSALRYGGRVQRTSRAAGCDALPLGGGVHMQGAFVSARQRDPHGAEFGAIHSTFFQYGLFANADNPLAVLTYALVHQCVLGKYTVVRCFAALSCDWICCKNSGLMARDARTGRDAVSSRPYPGRQQRGVV